MKVAARRIITLLATVAAGSTIGMEPLHAQIVPNAGDTGSIVTPVGNRFDISGGALSADNANLFHSLSQFGLTQSQIANFLANPTTRNILVRVTGGDASRVDGLIQVSGSTANLFLMNPAGIVFGANATLNVSGSFTATTATAIGVGANWFNASGSNNYAALVGAPSSYAFAVEQPGAIGNAGNLAVGVGQQLTLLGGTVVSTGSLTAPEGQIIVAAVPGQSVVRLSQPGAILSLDIQPLSPTDRVAPWTLPVLSLPQLLTGGRVTNATELTVNEQGQVVATGSGVQIVPGDVAVQETIAALERTLLRPIAPSQPIVLPPPPRPADRINSIAPPNQVLPIASPTSGRQPVPPETVLPTISTPTPTATPDCGAACPIRPPVPLPINTPLPSPIVTFPQVPPNQVLPSTLKLVPSALGRQAAPPDAVLPQSVPTLVVPDCASACPTPPSVPQPINTPLPPPIVTFPQNNNQNTGVVVLPEALPQYPRQPTARQTVTGQTAGSQAAVNQPSATQAVSVQPSSVQTSPVQTSSVQTRPVQASSVQAINLLLPTGDPGRILSKDAIEDMNQASALSRQLEAIRKQVQQRWQPKPQLSPLRYRLLLDAKGSIQRIVPIGQEAAAYLAALRLTELQPMPADTSTARLVVPSLEVLVTLNPDGTVEVIPNSLTLRSAR